MCGRFTLRPDGQIQEFLDTFNIDGQPSYSDDIAPGSQISIIYQKPAQLVTATWWLLLDHNTLKPNYKYASFNSRWDKLDQPRSISYKPFRESRCIIPASPFMEGLGDKKT